MANNTAVTRAHRHERRLHVSLRAAGMRSPSAATAWTRPAAVQIPREVIKGGSFLLFNLRTDPFERADTTSNTYWDWFMDRIFLMVPAQGIVGEFLQTFRQFPPRQKAASFTIDQVQAKIEAAVGSGD